MVLKSSSEPQDIHTADIGVQLGYHSSKLTNHYPSLRKGYKNVLIMIFIVELDPNPLLKLLIVTKCPPGKLVDVLIINNSSFGEDTSPVKEFWSCTVH
jgi:hypothetical protein